MSHSSGLLQLPLAHYLLLGLFPHVQALSLHLALNVLVYGQLLACGKSGLKFYPSSFFKHKPSQFSNGRLTQEDL